MSDLFPNGYSTSFTFLFNFYSNFFIQIFLFFFLCKVQKLKTEFSFAEEGDL